MAQDLSPQLVEYAERTVDDILEVKHLLLINSIKLVMMISLMYNCTM